MAPNTKHTLVQGADGTMGVEIHARGLAVLDDPQLNRGTAFTPEERDHLGLHGLLPSGLETIDQQVGRCYEQFNIPRGEVDVGPAQTGTRHHVAMVVGSLSRDPMTTISASAASSRSRTLGGAPKQAIPKIGGGRSR